MGGLARHRVSPPPPQDSVVCAGYTFRADFGEIPRVQLAQKGGQVMMKEITEVPGMGWFGILVDPGGAAFALWQPKM